jgi:hypothetical protein
MATVVTPINQELFPTPNQHINYTFNNNTVEEYRIVRYLNKISNIFGQDLVLWGIDLKEINLNSNILSVTLNEGTVIQDSTIIKILYEFTLTLNNLSLSCQQNSDYYVVVYTDFKFNPVTSNPIANPNNFLVKIGIFDTTTNILYNNDPTNSSSTQITWDSEKNRIVLFVCDITDFNNTKNKITIDSEEYNIRQGLDYSLFENVNNINCFNCDGGLI